MDELKKYLQENAYKMDVDSPSEQLFGRIAAAAGRKKANVLRIVFPVAAAACIVTGVLIGVRLLQSRNTGELSSSFSDTVIIKKQLAGSSRTSDTATTLLAKTAAARPEKILVAKEQHAKKIIPVAGQLLQSFEQNYSRLVVLQLNNIRQTPVYGEALDYFSYFKKELQQLESDERAVKATIKKSGLTDALLEQLITAYQGKIDLLKNLQHEIARVNAKIKENNPAADSLKTYFINI